MRARWARPRPADAATRRPLCSSSTYYIKLHRVSRQAPARPYALGFSLAGEGIARKDLGIGASANDSMLLGATPPHCRSR